MIFSNFIEFLGLGKLVRTLKDSRFYMSFSGMIYKPCQDFKIFITLFENDHSLISPQYIM